MYLVNEVKYSMNFLILAQGTKNIKRKHIYLTLGYKFIQIHVLNSASQYFSKIAVENWVFMKIPEWQKL